MAEVDLGAVDEFRDGAVTIVSASDMELGIVRLSDEVYALRNICPHQAGPVCRGRLVPRLDSEGAGSVRALDGPPVLTCAWHGWEFDVRTGRSVWDDSYGVKTYPARVHDGRVLVELGRRKGVVPDGE
jgi:nitrite reductase (NADH) small subunit